MICHICKQEEIYYSPDDEGIIRFSCSVCGGNFWTIKEFAYLLVFQHDVEKAYKLGKESFNSDLKDNPYNIEEEVLLHNKWDSGYNEEKEGYEREALLISSAKIKESLEEEVRSLKLKNAINHSLLRKVFGKISHLRWLDNKFFSKSYKKKIKEAYEEIIELYAKNGL